MVKYPTWIPDCDSHSPALLDSFNSSCVSICSTVAFHPLGNSDRVAVSVPIDFPTNWKQDTPFQHSCADWNGFCGHLRDIPWEDISKLCVSAASEICKWIQVGIHVYITHHRHQVKPHSSLWLSAACDAAIVHRNHFFHLYQQNKPSESKVKFKQTSNHRKLKLPKLHLLLKQKLP